MKHEASGGKHHDRVWMLLPWYVNGTLAGKELALVEDHLAACRLCRDEAEGCAAVAGALEAAGEAAPSPHPLQLSRLMGRIEAAEEATAASRGAAWLSRLGDGWFTAAPVLRGVLALQALAIVALVTGLLLQRPVASAPEAPASPFRTLSMASQPTSQPAASQVRVVFAEGIAEAEMRRLLRAVDAQIVGGPTPLGVYTLALPEDGEPLAVVVDHLRAQQQVRFAEPVAPLSTGVPRP